jgi:hypothetical protein
MKKVTIETKTEEMKKNENNISINRSYKTKEIKKIETQKDHIINKINKFFYLN